MPKDDKGKIKVRFFEVELDGSNETLLEGLKSFATIAGRTQSVVRVVQPAAPAQIGSPQQVENSEPIEAEATEVEQDRPQKPRKTRIYRTPEILDLDLKTGSVPFEEFCKQKNPTDTAKKYLVIAAWLKDNLKLDQINSDHVYTCYRAMGWGVERDVGRPFRNCKQSGYFRSAADNGSWEITHVGLGVVQKMATGN